VRQGTRSSQSICRVLSSLRSFEIFLAHDLDSFNRCCLVVFRGWQLNVLNLPTSGCCPGVVIHYAVLSVWIELLYCVSSPRGIHLECYEVYCFVQL